MALVYFLENEIREKFQYILILINDFKQKHILKEKKMFFKWYFHLFHIKLSDKNTIFFRAVYHQPS